MCFVIKKLTSYSDTMTLNVHLYVSLFSFFPFQTLVKLKYISSQYETFTRKYPGFPIFLNIC